MKAKRFLSAILCTLLMLTLLPVTAQAASLADLLNKLPESQPGNFTVRWYSAKRYLHKPGSGPTFDFTSGSVDKNASDAALQSWGTSVPLGQEQIPDLTFDMTKWQPDPEYQTFYIGQTPGPKYNWNWCEVEGFIKLPDLYYIKWSPVGIDPLQHSDVTFDLEIPDNGRNLSPGTFVPFRLHIKCYEPDQSKLNAPLSIAFNYTWSVGGDKTTIPAENIFGTLELKDMQPFFQLDAQKYTLTLDPKYSSFNVDAYEYGLAGGTDFRPLSFGTNRLEPGSGEVIVRYKNLIIAHPSITIGAITMPAEGSLLVTGRTPATAFLAWFAPPGDTAPASYDIYRQKVDVAQGFTPYLAIATINVYDKALKIGSTSGLTFTDQGLSYDAVYTYYVIANYSAGYSTASNTVRTDSVPMEGLPSIPDNLEIQLANQSSKADLKLSWTASDSPAGIKEYVVYRNITRASAATQIPNGTIVLGGIDLTAELGRTSDLSFIDCGLNYTDKCEYSVQALDKNGVPSYISAPLEVSLQDFVPNLKLYPNSLGICNGDTSNLTVFFDSSYTGETSGMWTVADSSVASVEGYSTKPIEINPKHTIPGNTGAKVTGLKPGATTVTFTNTTTGAHGDCTVTVKPTFAIAPDPITVYEAETGSLSINYDDGYTGSKAGRWSVDDQAVASIDQNGVVTGIKAGTAIAAYAIRPTAAPETRAGESAGAANGALVVTPMSASPADNFVRTVPVVVKPANYTVSFDARVGSLTPKGVTVKHDTAVARPDNPSYNNFLFLGWYTASDGGSMWNFTDDKVTKDMTLYAQWAVPVMPSNSGSGGHRSVYIAPTITGPDSIDLTAGYPSADQAYTVSGNPAPALAITANTAGATLSGKTLTIPAGLGAGSYSVTLEASSSTGTATKTVLVNVAAAPTAPTITGPDSIVLPPAYTSGIYPYSVAGSPTAYGIANVSSHSEFFSFDGANLSITSSLATGDSPYTLTLTATNSAGTATKNVTVYVISLEPASLGVDEGQTDDETLLVYGAGLLGTYTLQLGPGHPGWVTLSGNTLTAAPPAETVTSGLSEDFMVDVVITVADGSSITTSVNISVSVP